MQVSTGSSLLTFADIVRIIRDSRTWLFGVMAVVLLLAVAFAFLMVPKYRSEVLLAQVVDDSGSSPLGAFRDQLSGIASFAGVDVPQSDNDKATILATLRSRSFTLKFVADRDLRPVLFASDWDPQTEAWLSPELAPSDADVIRRFDGIRNVAEDRATGLVTLSIEWVDRHQAANWANQLVHDLNRYLRDVAIEEAEKSTAYLQRELETTSIVGLQQAIFRLIEVQINKIMLANVREEYALKIVDAAIVADEGDYSTPSRVLVILAGIMLGLVAGLFVVFVRHAFRAL